MSDESNQASAGRRRFLLVSAAGLAAAPIARLAIAQNAEKVDENSPPAKALDYHPDAAKVTNPKRKKDQFCHNCSFFQATAKDKWGPCTVFQGKQVAAAGWCSTWVAKT
jgi:High potential iron-sulfur protein